MAQEEEKENKRMASNETSGGVASDVFSSSTSNDG
jgi:hypothetical protein